MMGLLQNAHLGVISSLLVRRTDGYTPPHSLVDALHLAICNNPMMGKNIRTGL